MPRTDQKQVQGSCKQGNTEEDTLHRCYNIIMVKQGTHVSTIAGSQLSCGK